jgi:DnaK suppressor protein
MRMQQKKRRTRHLTGKELENLKGKLIRQKEDLWREILDALERDAGLEFQQIIQHAVRDQGEEALVQLKESTIFALVEIKYRELENIEQAIKQLETGAYGFCVACGERIPSARLEAMPSAIRCRQCQEKLELIGSV